MTLLIHEHKLGMQERARLRHERHMENKKLMDMIVGYVREKKTATMQDIIDMIGDKHKARYAVGRLVLNDVMRRRKTLGQGEVGIAYVYSLRPLQRD